MSSLIQSAIANRDDRRPIGAQPSAHRKTFANRHRLQRLVALTRSVTILV